MRCPTCQSTSRKIIDTDINQHGQRMRRSACHHCGGLYKTVEVDYDTFIKIVELVRARRDLDQQLLDTLKWNTHYGTAWTTEDQQTQRQATTLDT